MIENNPVLSGDKRFLGRAIMALWAERTRRVRPRSAIHATVRLSQSTATVDNFVGNPAGRFAEARKLRVSNGLLKN
jgi:hypothetical protein